MIRDILTNRWCIGGFGFLIVFAVLCYFWLQHDITSFQQQLSATDDIVLQGDMSQKAQKPDQTDVPLAESLESIKNRSESVEDTSVPTEETTAKTDTFEKNIDLAADAPPSPFGFGPYPEVPADYPNRARVQLWDNATPEHELLVRVRIKLWKQGTQTTGAIFNNSNGLIYPSIPNVIYVQWHYVEEGPPEYVGQRYATRVMGAPNTAEKWKSSYLTEFSFERTDKNIETSGIKVYEYPDGGIDPYNFLDLPR